MFPDIEGLVGAISDVERIIRGNYHITLGEMIRWLKNYREQSPDRFGVSKVFWLENHTDESLGGIGINDLGSYRGHYSDLYFAETDKETWTGEELLDQCETVLDDELEGYKGGQYVMDARTPLWISSHGEASGLAVVFMKTNKAGDIFLITRNTDRNKYPD